MNTTGLIILGILFLFNIICIFSKTLGKNYVIRVLVSNYILILGILSVIRSSGGMIYGFYLGIISIIISGLVLIKYKKDFKKAKFFNFLGIVISTIGTYFAYIR